MFDNEIRDEIELAADNWRGAMPGEIRRQAQLARRDLFSGPVYLDPDGDPVSCFDEGASRFDFSSAVDAVSEWAESVSDLDAEIAYCEETGESIYESIDGSREAILREIFGAELARFL